MPTPAAISASLAPLFVKVGIGADPDWAVGDEPPTDRQHTILWRLGATAHAAMLFFRFIRNDGTEVKAATFKADAFWKNGSSWKRIARTEQAHPAAEGLRLDLGAEGVLAVRLYDIVATDAVRVEVTAQEWGAD